LVEEQAVVNEAAFAVCLELAIVGSRDHSQRKGASENKCSNVGESDIHS